MSIYFNPRTRSGSKIMSIDTLGTLHSVRLSKVTWRHRNQKGIEEKSERIGNPDRKSPIQIHPTLSVQHRIHGMSGIQARQGGISTAPLPNQKSTTALWQRQIFKLSPERWDWGSEDQRFTSYANGTITPYPKILRHQTCRRNDLVLCWKRIGYTGHCFKRTCSPMVRFSR